MSETQEKKEIVKAVEVKAPQSNEGSYNAQRSRSRMQRPGKRGDQRNQDKPQDPFESKIISIRRVTKMHKGGRRMKISVAVVVGDKKGRVGIGVAKGEDVKSAQEKAANNAKKNLILVNLKGNTIPHDITFKFKASKILLKPAAPGTGIIAGSSVRQVVGVAGISDILGKIIGANNKITNAYATVYALAALRNTRL